MFRNEILSLRNGLNYFINILKYFWKRKEHYEIFLFEEIRKQLIFYEIMINVLNCNERKDYLFIELSKSWKHSFQWFRICWIFILKVENCSKIFKFWFMLELMIFQWDWINF
jgi:hypothetical protein